MSLSRLARIISKDYSTKAVISRQLKLSCSWHVGDSPDELPVVSADGPLEGLVDVAVVAVLVEVGRLQVARVQV